jgi:tetratricopeptide (TPR) repeat protein
VSSYAFLQGQGLYGEAEEVLRQQLAIQSRQPSPQRMAALNNLGNVLRYLGKYAQAEEAYNHALLIANASFPKRVADSANIQINIAKVELHKGNYSEAERLCEKALNAIGMLVSPPGHLQHASFGLIHVRGKECLANTFRLQGKYLAAEQMMQEVVSSVAELKGPLSVEYSFMLNNLGMMHKYLGKHVEAASCYTKSLSILEASGSLHPLGLSNVYYNQAGVHHATGQHRKGIHSAKRALKLRLDLLGPAHPETALAYCMLAANLIGTNRLKHSVLFLSRAQQILSECFGPVHRDIAMIINHLGVIAFKQGDYLKAAERFREAFEMKTVCLGDKHPDLLLPILNIARTLAITDTQAAVKDKLEYFIDLAKASDSLHLPIAQIAIEMKARMT